MDWQLVDLGRDFIAGIAAPESFNESYHIVISDDEVLTTDGVYPWRPLDQDQWRWLGLDVVASHYLGQINNVPVFTNEVDPEADNPEGYEFMTLWSFVSQVDPQLFSLIGRARQIVEWNRNHRYCGRCGQEIAVVATGLEIQCSQPRC